MVTIIKAPNYTIDKLGVIRNKKTNKIMKSYVDQLGYEQIVLRVDKQPKHFRVHTLMRDAFLLSQNDDNKKTMINHIDGIKTNNILTNLELCTNAENVKHAYDNGLYTNKKRSHEIEIDGVIYKSIRAASDILHLNRKRLTGILKGQIPNHTSYNIIRYVTEGVETMADECKPVE